jgi:addiction module HigA family antidote
MTAATRIGSAIAKRQWTQKEAARQLNISEQYLSDILRGRRAISAFVAVRVERVLGLDANKLMYIQTVDEMDKARKEYR